MWKKYLILLFLNFAFVTKPKDVIASKALNERTYFAFQNQFLWNGKDQTKKDHSEPIIVSLEGEIAGNAIIPVNVKVSRAGK
jgi:hypothetical protein